MKPISNELQKAWDRFSNSANWSGLHPLDEDRFYQFLVLAYNEGHELTDRLIDTLIPQHNLANGMRDRLVSIAETASGILDVERGKGRRG